MIKPSDRTRDAAYGPLAAAPEKAFAAFEKHLTGPDGPKPEWVAEVVAGLVAAPRGKRPFRTTVDRLGMGAAVDVYNQTAEELMKKVYTAFKMADALTLKT